jgi:hypothetical protein
MESLKNETTQYYLMKLLGELHLLKVILNLKKFISYDCRNQRNDSLRKFLQFEDVFFVITAS